MTSLELSTIASLSKGNGSARNHRAWQRLEMNRQDFLFAVQDLPLFALEMLHDLEEPLQLLKDQLAQG